MFWGLTTSSGISIVSLHGIPHGQVLTFHPPITLQCLGGVQYNHDSMPTGKHLSVNKGNFDPKEATVDPDICNLAGFPCAGFLEMELQSPTHLHSEEKLGGAVCNDTYAPKHLQVRTKQGYRWHLGIRNGHSVKCGGAGEGSFEVGGIKELLEQHCYPLPGQLGLGIRSS